MSEADLRAMVREVLREALGKQARSGGAAASPAASSTPSAPEQVRIANDADLVAFVRRLVALLDDPATGAAVRAGRHRFTLAPSKSPAPPRPASASGAAHGANGATIELDGTVTEAKINKCAGAAAIMLAPDAVITPLGRDRARALGVKIERRR